MCPSPTMDRDRTVSRRSEPLSLIHIYPGRVFDREQILSRIWGSDFFGDTRTVDTHIKRLRQKLSCDEMGLLVWEEAHARGLQEEQMLSLIHI